MHPTTINDYDYEKKKKKSQSEKTLGASTSKNELETNASKKRGTKQS
jgi:hypothetical protein